MIRLVKVNKYFNRRKSNEIHVINNTSIELEDKGLVTFLGVSGCGKTTLLNAIGGLDRVQSGDIYIDGERLTRRTDGRKDEIRNAYIGYIFQNYNLIEDKTVFFNVEIALRMMGIKDKAEIEKRVMYILNKVGMERYRNRPAKALSGGERQRVGIARALVKNPRIIIADEPTGNLDSRNTIEIMNIIKAISRDRLVILVTHERELAQFYASRIVEIVDGKIVSDSVNRHDSELDYHMENRIYLKDLPVQKEFSDGGVEVEYYGDNEEESVKIKVVVKNNNIYLGMPRGFREGSGATELVDGHYQKLSKDVYEDYQFNYNEIAGKQKRIKYTSVFSLSRLIVNGFKKIFSFSLVKKILMAGFVFASCFTIFAVSRIAAITTINDEKFIGINKNYLTVEAGKITPELYDKFKNMEGVDYVIPGNSLVTLTMPLNDYYQSFGNSQPLTGSAAGKDMLGPDKMILGSIPHNPDEIVLDKMLVKTILKSYQLKWMGITAGKDLIGRKVYRYGTEFKTYRTDDLALTISGICDTGNPCIYMDPSIFFDLPLQSGAYPSGTGNMTGYGVDYSNPAGGNMNVKDYGSAVASGEVTVMKGRLPENDYEVMLPADMSYAVKIGKTADIVINGKKLTVTGFYEDKRLTRQGEAINYVNTNTSHYALLESQDRMVISPSDKEATYEKLRAEHVKVTDNYAMDRENYMDRIKDKIMSTLAVSLIILIISLVEIYLMLRSSFLSRIKEVGVLRAIGLKKKDVYKMFMGEIIAMTLITALPSMAFMAYVLNELKAVPYLGEDIMMNPVIFAFSLGLVFAANMLFGLLPALNTMRKTPAAILARNDVN